jgi:hypothetical protein
MQLTPKMTARKGLLFLIILFVFLNNNPLYAQPVTTTKSSNAFGGTTTITVDDNGLGTRTTTEEYYDDDKPPKLREKIIRVKNRIEGDSSIKSVTFSEKGDTAGVKEQIFDKDEKEIFHQNIQYKFGHPKSGYRWQLLPDGTRERSDYDEKTGTFEKEKTDGKWKVKESYRQQKDKTFDLSAGYSYLSASNGDESESFPIGGYFTLAYFLNIRLALLGDFSIHSKKDQELRTTVAFLMGGLQYNLLRERQKKMMLYARALLGIAFDKQRYSFEGGSNTNSASAFAIAFGVGSQLPLNDRIAINLLVDYIRTNFNNDGQNNIRAGACIRFILVKK